MRKPVRIFMCLFCILALLAGCVKVPPVPSAVTDSPVPDIVPSESVPAVSEQPLTPEPTASETPATPDPGSHYVFRPKVVSSYARELFGDKMCDAWFNLVDAVMAGEDSFACPDDETFAWVLGQFPDKFFPVMSELIIKDPTVDPDHPVQNGMGRITYLTTPIDAAIRIADFSEQVEKILNEALEDDYSDFEKMYALYAYFSSHYTYDYETYDRLQHADVDYTKPYRVFSLGTGICGEIAPAYAYLLLQAGVDAANMSGIRSYDKSGHDWAYVKLNGKNYHIDPTYALSSEGRLDYFLMDDNERENQDGYLRKDFHILSNYAQDHPHPDYQADDDTFRPLWGGIPVNLDHASHTLYYRILDAEGDEKLQSFDYSGF
ncbi:MAG: hypothetical protein II781_02065 [Clostridia bacterium]|nr:hypothetical protein [Clostridia bacterium]